jgi:hypothetical protein
MQRRLLKQAGVYNVLATGSVAEIHEEVSECSGT